MIQKSTISLAVLALISCQSSAIKLDKQVSADDFAGAGEGGSIPQVTEDEQGAPFEKLDDVSKGEQLSHNAGIMAINNQVKSQQMSEALNMAKNQAENERKGRINNLTGLVDKPDGSHEFPDGRVVGGANDLS